MIFCISVPLYLASLFSSPEEEILHKIEYTRYCIEESDYMCYEDTRIYPFYVGKVEAYQECLDIFEKYKDKNQINEKGNQ